MRTFLKHALDGLAVVVVAPLAAISALEKYALPGSEEGFHFGAHMVSFCPGLPGVYLRRAFYRLTLDACARECYFAFGAVFTHRTVVVERDVYLGTFALVGSAHLREGTSVGSRASLLSGIDLHEFKNGRWTGYDGGKLRQIRVGPHALIGEGAIVMNDIGSATLVAAGAVVASAVPDGVVMAGNPARFVRRLERDAHEAS